MPTVRNFLLPSELYERTDLNDVFIESTVGIRFASQLFGSAENKFLLP